VLFRDCNGFNYFNFVFVIEIKSIVVVGATGMLAIPVVKALVADKAFRVTIFVRSIAKAKSTFGNTVNYVEGKLENESDISRALCGHDAVYLNLSVAQNSSINNFQPEREGLANILKIAATMPQIKHISYLSSIAQFYSAKQHWVLQLKRNALVMLKQAGIAYTIFYPSTFMETLLYKQVKGNLLYTVAQPSAKMWWIAAKDYALQVVADYKQETATNREYYVQGTEALTMDAAIQMFIEHYPHTKFKVIKVPLWLMRIGGLFSKQASYGHQIMDGMVNYPERFEAENTWANLGKPTTHLIKYTKGL
jgi:uncharacterized protein YbjT (DUF2867 family)